MSEIVLPQAHADALIAMEKHRSTEDRHCPPPGGQALELSLNSPDRRESLLLDIAFGRINLAMAKLQNRTKRVVILIRLDLNGSPHRNPDGEEVPTPHIHIYREGFGDKWAYPVPADRFRDLGDIHRTILDFFKYCNVTQPPRIDWRLFT